MGFPLYIYGINSYYLMFMLPAFLITLFAQIKMKSTFAKYSKVPTIKGLTGAQAARMILDQKGLSNVQIEYVRGSLSDHYDPKTNVVRLSDATYSSATVGAVGVAAHECGHAIQYAEGYGPIKLRSSLVPITKLGSSLSMPLIVFGLFLGYMQFVYFGIILFAIAVLFQLVTLPVEFNASSRAIKILDETNMVTAEENAGVRKVLTAAAFTYLAGLLSSMLQLLYFLTLAGGRRRN